MVAHAHMHLRSYCPKHFSSVRYGEAVFQISWRSVHKWRRNLVHRFRTDGRFMWFYLMSNAYALDCIGQTKTQVYVHQLRNTCIKVSRKPTWFVSDYVAKYEETSTTALSADPEVAVPLLTIHGWMLMQRKVTGGSVSFNHNWAEYRDGFGSATDDDNYWLGLDKLYRLMQLGSVKLRVEVCTLTNCWLPSLQDYNRLLLSDRLSLSLSVLCITACVVNIFKFLPVQSRWTRIVQVICAQMWVNPKQMAIVMNYIPNESSRAAL